MSSFQHLQWSVALLCMLFCLAIGDNYCIIASQNAECSCLVPCLTLSELAGNISDYTDSNLTLILQPGNHTLNSSLSIFNSSSFEMYSNESTASITCTEFAQFHFYEVSIVDIHGVEFFTCGNIQITHVDKFTFSDSAHVQNDTSTRADLVLNRTETANIGDCLFIGTGLTIVKQSFVTINGITISENRNQAATLTVYDSRVDFTGSSLFTNNYGPLLAYNATIQFLGNTKFSNCINIAPDLQNSLLEEKGGAITSYLSRMIFHGNATFTNNSAKYGGAVYAIESSILFQARNNTSSQPNVLISNNTATSNGGGVYLYRSTFEIREGECYIADNVVSDKGGGIHATYSDINMEPLQEDRSRLLLLARNRAQLGGGIHLEGASRLKIYVSNSSIQLVGNSADYGGAIYVDDNTKYEACFATPSVMAVSECFFHVTDPYNLMEAADHRLSEESLVLNENVANFSGSNLYGGLLDRCASPLMAYDIRRSLTAANVSLQQSTDGLTYLQLISNVRYQTSDSISSLPARVCSCANNLPNCTTRSLTITLVRKGQLFNVSVAAVDQVGSPLRAVIRAYPSSVEDDIDRRNRTQYAEQCTNLSYSVFSPNDFSALNLYPDGPCRSSELSQLRLMLNFTPCSCPIGFEISPTDSDTHCQCICDHLIFPQYISGCSEPYIMRKINSWINHRLDSETNKSTYSIGRICPFRYCYGQTEIDLSTEYGFEAQCIEGRRGVLCGRCSENYSIALSGKRCVRCPHIWPLLLVVEVLGAFLAGLGLVISIMAINFTVAIGTINGFIFYVNILNVFDMIFLPFDETNFPELMIEWLNLDPGLDVCFFPANTIYSHGWIRLLFPLYIISIVILIIVVSQRSVRFSQLIGKRSPIAVLATLILLCYGNFLQTSLLVLSPSVITNVNSDRSYNELVWLLDGNIKYLGAKHVPLFLVALFILSVAIAYKIIIFSWQWVVRSPKVWILKWTNNQKFNEFIKAYQAPYSDEHRYWTGLLLLVRVVLTLISIFTASTNPDISVLFMIVTLGILLLYKISFAKKLYKKWSVDVLETVLIFNLFVLTTITYFTNDDNTERVLAYLSISLTVLLLLMTIAYHIYAYVLVSRFPNLKWRKRSFSLKAKKEESLNETPAQVFFNHDRYQEIIGDIDLPNVQVDQEPAKPVKSTLKPKQQSPKTVTSTTIDLTELESEKEQSDEQVVADNTHLDTPYLRINPTIKPNYN